MLPLRFSSQCHLSDYDTKGGFIFPPETQNKCWPNTRCTTTNISFFLHSVYFLSRGHSSKSVRFGFGSEGFSVRKRSGFTFGKISIFQPRGVGLGGVETGPDLWVEVERWSFPWWQQRSLLLQLLLKRLFTAAETLGESRFLVLKCWNHSKNLIYLSDVSLPIRINWTLSLREQSVSEKCSTWYRNLSRWDQNILV